MRKFTVKAEPSCSEGAPSNDAVKGGPSMVAVAARTMGLPPTHTAFAALHGRTGSVSVALSEPDGRTVRTHAVLLPRVLRRARVTVAPVTSSSESRTVA